MGTYSAGDETKELILQTCRELFYEKGYNKTTFRDIAQATHTHSASVAYHFKTKETLLKIIADEMYDKLCNEVALYTDDVNMQYILGVFFLWYKVTHDEKFCRFYACYFESPLRNNKPAIHEMFQITYEIYEMKPNNLEEIISKYKIQYRICLEVGRVLLKYYIENPNDYTFVELAEIDWETTAKLLDLDKNKTKQKLIEAEKILDEVDFSKLDTTLY